jgi:hypothetical protein
MPMTKRRDLFDPSNPKQLLPEQRLAEVTAILAAGVIRMRGQGRSPCPRSGCAGIGSAAPDHALRLLIDHYNPRCEPPWLEKELRHKVEDAADKPHERPPGWLRAGDVPPSDDSDLSAFKPAMRVHLDDARNQHAERPPDPGPLPEHLLRVPGFIGEVMDFSLATASYPNTAMAFCGALALQAFLAGRKVRDSGDTRTNVYLLGLAHSAAGKDHPRKAGVPHGNRPGLLRRDRAALGEVYREAGPANL